MKHLLNGVAIAAALVIAGPVWAQAPAPSSAAPAMAGPKASGGARVQDTAPPMAMHQKHRPMRHTSAMPHHHMGKVKASAGDATTDQLNRDELARLQGGGAPPPMMAPPPMQEGPRPSGH